MEARSHITHLVSPNTRNRERMYLPGIVLAHPEHAQTSTNGGCGHVERQRQRAGMTTTTAYLRQHLPPFEDIAATWAPTDNLHRDKNNKNLPFRTVVVTQRLVE